jgi:hypothetical protein
MLVTGGQLGAAQFAMLDRRPLADEAAESGE